MLHMKSPNAVMTTMHAGCSVRVKTTWTSPEGVIVKCGGDACAGSGNISNIVSYSGTPTEPTCAPENRNPAFGKYCTS